MLKMGSLITYEYIIRHHGVLMIILLHLVIMCFLYNFGQILEYSRILVRVENQPFLEPRMPPTHPLIFGLWCLNFCGLPKVYRRTWVVPCGSGMLLITLCLREKGTIYLKSHSSNSTWS